MLQIMRFSKNKLCKDSGTKNRIEVTQAAWCLSPQVEKRGRSKCKVAKMNPVSRSIKKNNHMAGRGTITSHIILEKMFVLQSLKTGRMGGQRQKPPSSGQRSLKGCNVQVRNDL